MKGRKTIVVKKYSKKALESVDFDASKSAHPCKEFVIGVTGVRIDGFRVKESWKTGEK